MNFVRIRLRNPSQANAKITSFQKLTAKELQCWFHRNCGIMLSYRHRNIWYDYNMEFDHRNPLGYQWSRVQVDDNYENPYENTRQYMCLFCQEPCFFKLTGLKSLLFHLQFAHPCETPAFVTIIMQMLDLLPQRGAYSCGEVKIPYDIGYFTDYWTDLEYFEDGVSNKLCFHRTPQLTNPDDSLGSVDQYKVKPWYFRDVEDFRKYQHRNVQYALNPDFDDDNPTFYQISRVLCRQDGRRIRLSRQLLCMYCRQPKFFPMFHGSNSYLSHLVDVHYPVDLPDLDTAYKPVLKDHVYLVSEPNGNYYASLPEEQREKAMKMDKKYLALLLQIETPK